MNTSLRILGLGLGAVLLGVASGITQQESSIASPDTAGIADTLVNKSANIRYGELVLISGGVRDQQLLEDIAIEVRKLGAHPVITISSDRLTRNIFTQVPARFDNQEPTFVLRMAETINAMISVDYRESFGILADVPAERRAAHAKAFEPVHKKMLERSVIHTHLGNGLYPTKALAEQFGITRNELSRIFWRGVNVDYDQLQATGERVKNILAAGREVRITAPNGTDLTVEITRRPIFVSDGVISTDDRYAGGPACQVWL
ncbi:MAG: aminopeptidase, partial [Planctomycetota bacterium]|nr:aminopeptidase [Planctomycetota bacterium]